MFAATIIISLIVSIDSFFLGMLCPKRSLTSAMVIALSPLLHGISGFMGFHLHLYSKTLGMGFFGIIILIILISSIWIIVKFDPTQRFKGIWDLHPDDATSNSMILIMLFFCSLDALAGGYILGYWNASLVDIVLYIAISNFIVIISSIIIKSIMTKSNSTHTNQY